MIETFSDLLLNALPGCKHNCNTKSLLNSKTSCFGKVVTAPIVYYNVHVIKEKLPLKIYSSLSI